jgi:hypothetical protein
MCYNSPMSFTFAMFGVLITAYIVGYKPALKHTGIHYILIYYTIMEFLQGVQYFFVNQCQNLWNRYLTEIAYVLVICQPLIWNMFYYQNSNKYDKQIFITAIWLAVVWMSVNILSRILYDKNVDPQTRKNSVYAADKVCTKKNLTHLYWQWTSANFNDLNANMLTYLMLWFIPALISSKFRMCSIVLICSALLAAYITHLTKEILIFTSLWCYVSVPVIMFVLLFAALK